MTEDMPRAATGVSGETALLAMDLQSEIENPMLNAIALLPAHSGRPAVAPRPAVRAAFDADQLHEFTGQWSGAEIAWADGLASKSTARG